MKQHFEELVQHLLNGNIFMDQAVEILERGMIDGALKRSSGNQSAASKLLGIHRNTLQRKMVEYSLGNGRTRARRKPAASARRTGRRKVDAA